MKKITALLMLLTLLLVFCGCGQHEPAGTTLPFSEQDTTTANQNTETVDTSETMPAQSAWGIADTFAAASDSGSQGYTIHFPALTGIPEVTGLVAYQNDDTLVIVDGQTLGISEDVTGVDDVFPTYFKQTTNILSVYKPISNKDYSFEITQKEMVQVNGYDMCKYTGELTYMARKEPVSSQFVAYATQLKGNDAYIYWLVLDESADQSLGALIDSHAENMATTLREHQ